MTLEIRISRLDSMDEIYTRTIGRINVTDPLAEIRVTYHVRSCMFPIAGRYQVSLLAEKELIAQRVLVVSSKGQ